MISADYILDFRISRGISKTAFAKQMEISVRTLQNWESKGVPDCKERRVKVLLERSLRKEAPGEPQLSPRARLSKFSTEELLKELLIRQRLVTS